MTKSDAKKEVKEYNQIKKIQNLNKYAISTPTYCDPEIDATFISNVTNCTTNKVNIKGLMCIPPNGLSPDPFFRSMINLKNKINNELLLSMGMSGDYMNALKTGSNLIRIGSAFFNE